MDERIVDADIFRRDQGDRAQVCVVTQEGGHVQLVASRTVRNQTSDVVKAYLGLFDGLYRRCQQEHILCFVDIRGCSQAAASLLGRASMFPWAVFVDQRPVGWYERLVGALDGQLPPPEPLTVATDGSARADGKRGLGWACVAEDGRFALGSSAAGSDISRAELNGVRLALHTFRGPLRVLTDSRNTVLWANSPAKAPRGLLGAACDAAALLVSSGSTIAWVKGHAGNVLNEQADRLARMSRLHVGGVYGENVWEVAARVTGSPQAV